MDFALPIPILPYPGKACSSRVLPQELEPFIPANEKKNIPRRRDMKNPIIIKDRHTPVIRIFITIVINGR